MESYKDEILDAMRKEFVTRELFDEKMNTLRIELEGKIENVRVGLEGKIENVRVGLEGKIELVKTDIKRLDMKLNFLIILMIIALTLMNPVMAEIIKIY